MKRLMVLLLLLSAAGQASAQLATLPFDDSADRQIYKTMVRRLHGTRMTVDWDEIGLGEAVRHIARNVRFNMMLSKEIREREEEPVNLKLKDVSAMTIVKLLKQQFDIEFQHRHGVLVVTTEEDALKKAMVLGIYGIRLITYTPPDFPAPGILGLRPGPPPEPVEEEEQKDPRFSEDFVVDLIRQTTGGDKVWDIEGASLSAHNGKLIVRHAPHIQARVKRMLNRLR